MSLTDVLSAAEISAALRECQAPDSFNPKKFFSTCGITKKTPTQVKEIFKVLDNDHSGFIEEEEVKFLLQRFDAGARLLTSTETREFMTTCDHDGDGKIGADDIWKEMARVLYTATYLSCPNNSRKWFIPKHRVVSIEGCSLVTGL